MTTFECNQNNKVGRYYFTMPVDYAQISSTENQRPSVTTPVVVELNQNDSINGIEHSIEDPSTIKITDSGIYVLIAAPQVGRTSGKEARYVDFWLRKNGNDIQNSNVRVVIDGNAHKDVIVNQTMMPFNAGDIVNIMMSVEVPDEGLGIEAIHPPGEPLIPSIIFSMHKIKDISEVRYISTGKGTGRMKISS